MGELAEAGCVAFSHADAPLADTQMLLRALQYAATFGYPVWLRPQDAISRAAASRTTARSRPGWACRHSGRPRKRSRWPRSSGSRARPARACTRAGCRRREGVALVREAKQEGLQVTCDVGVHHVHLCDIDIGWFDAQSQLMPPLRSMRDRDALRGG